jgi:hypothetical protein
MPVKLPGPELGTAEQAVPNGADAEPAEPLELELSLIDDELDAVDGAALDELPDAAGEDAEGLLELLPHALALTAIAAEHNRAAAVLLRVENMVSSLIR